MELKLVIAVRNGINVFDLLTGPGIASVSKTAESIQKRALGAKKIALLTSPKNHAVETATIIGVRLGIGHRCLDSLGIDVLENGEPQMEDIMKCARGCDIVIAVTHFFLAPHGIINAFSRKYFEKEVYREEVPNGCGLCLSMESAEVCYLP